MYLRFVTEKRTSHGGRREGFFQAAEEAVDNPETPGFSVDRINDYRGWFGAHLAVPDRFNRGSVRTGRRATTTGISWFRPEATEHIENAFALCAILQDLGYPISVLKTTRPGFIIYQDAHQIVAEPFADTPI